MVEEIEVKRKVFTIVEQIGERSYKVERKGQYFFLKKYEDRAEEFEQVCDGEHRLRVSGVVVASEAMKSVRNMQKHLRC